MFETTTQLHVVPASLDIQDIFFVFFEETEKKYPSAKDVGQTSGRSPGRRSRYVEVKQSAKMKSGQTWRFSVLRCPREFRINGYPGIPTTIKTTGVNITTTAYLRVLIIGIGSTIILMVVEALGLVSMGYLTYL